MPFRASPAQTHVERGMEHIADVDEAIHCLECGHIVRACRCLMKLRRELVAENALAEMRTAAVG